MSASVSAFISRVGQNHIYTVYIRCFWQEIHQIYGHIRCIYTVLANPVYKMDACQQDGVVVGTGQGNVLQDAAGLVLQGDTIY